MSHQVKSAGSRTPETHVVARSPQLYAVSFEFGFSKKVTIQDLQRAVAGINLWPPYEARKKEWVWEQISQPESRAAPYWRSDNIHPITRVAVYYKIYTGCRVDHQGMSGAENLQAIILQAFLRKFQDLRIRSCLHLTSVPICADPKSEIITSVMLA